MRLLVSVSCAAEASAALAGGADVIDAKDPLAGALGAVSAEVLREIHAIVGGRRPVTAALGDAADEAAIECAARTFAAAGAALVKVGFAGIDCADRVATLTAAAVRGASAGSDGGAAVVAVAYADADRVASLAPPFLVEVAARAGAQGVLLDTADKSGPGLSELVEPRTLAAWVSEAHDAGLLVALAGKLTAADLTFVRDAGADIAGVRGAACDGGRTGRVAAEKVRLLRVLGGPAAAARRARPPDSPTGRQPRAATARATLCSVGAGL
jgi:uncharacterized protein (UPF0264 family)